MPLKSFGGSASGVITVSLVLYVSGHRKRPCRIPQNGCMDAEGCTSQHVQTSACFAQRVFITYAACKPYVYSVLTPLALHYRVMLVGWGGNNGSTVTAGCLANKQ